MRYAITNHAERATEVGADAREARRAQMLYDVARWTAAGIDFVQLREKSLGAGELFLLARETLDALGQPSRRPRLLVNGRPDIAAAAGADGVHLTSRVGELTPAQARQIFAAANLPRCVVSVSCHTIDEVAAARDADADLILLGPVFEKRVGGSVVAPGQGLVQLHRACATAGAVPVLALGGVTSANQDVCLQAGAAGVAGIRLFGA